MAREPRVVAELGRPETPQETAERRAASSQTYRQSQTTRNLVAALLITLGVVLVVVLAVPRGEFPARDSLDPAPIAAEAARSFDRAVIVPEIPETWLLDSDGAVDDERWRVNVAAVEGTNPSVWTVAFVPSLDGGFLRLGQAFDAEQTWAVQRLDGVSPNGSITIDGRTWDVFSPRDPAAAGNVAYALGTQAGADYVLLYGTAGPEVTGEMAELIEPQLRDIEEAQ